MLEIMEGHMRCRSSGTLPAAGHSRLPDYPQLHIVEAPGRHGSHCEIDADYITVRVNSLRFLPASALAPQDRGSILPPIAGPCADVRGLFQLCGDAPPVVMSIVNRAMGAPLSIWNDQQDSISLRDSGWLQLYAEDNQEATDLHYLAYKVAEDHRILLPSFVCFDGFILSHTTNRWIPSPRNRRIPISAFRPYQRLDAADPVSFGLFASPDYYMEFRYAIDQALDKARSVYPGSREGV